MIKYKEVPRRRQLSSSSSSPEMPSYNVSVIAMVHPLPGEKSIGQQEDTYIKRRKICHSTPIDYDAIEIDTSIKSKKDVRLRKEINMPRSLHQILEKEDISSIKDVTTEISLLKEDAQVKLSEIKEIDNNNNSPQLPASKRRFSSSSSTDEKIKPVKVAPRKQKSLKSDKGNKKVNKPKYKKIKSNKTKSKPVTTKLDMVMRDHVHDGYESLHSDDEAFKIHNKTKKKVLHRAHRKYKEKPLHFKTPPPSKSSKSSQIFSPLPELEIESNPLYKFRWNRSISDSDISMIKSNTSHRVEPLTQPIETINPILEFDNSQTIDCFSQVTRKIVCLDTTKLREKINQESNKKIEKASKSSAIINSNMKINIDTIECDPEKSIKTIECDPKKVMEIIECNPEHIEINDAETSTIFQDEANNIELNNPKEKDRHVGEANIMSWIASGAPPNTTTFCKEFMEQYIKVYASNIKLLLDRQRECEDPSTSKQYDVLLKNAHLIDKYFKKHPH